MNILSIGNGISSDAHRFLPQMALADDEELLLCNLYIENCSLEQHWNNWREEKTDYDYEVYLPFETELNRPDGVALHEAVEDEDWDIITLQQTTALSGIPESYSPFLSELAEYCRMVQPNAKIMVHQTWAYEQGSKLLDERGGYLDQHDMFNDLEKAYQKAEKAISADGIIPSGKVMMQAIDNGIGQIHRDTLHVDLGVGRYMLGLVWFKVLTGETAKCKFNEFDVEVDEKQVDIAIATVKEVLGE